MKRNKSEPLKQMKISSFCFKKPNGKLVESVKRKTPDEVDDVEIIQPSKCCPVSFNSPTKEKKSTVLSDIANTPGIEGRAAITELQLDILDLDDDFFSENTPPSNDFTSKTSKDEIDKSKTWMQGQYDLSFVTPKICVVLKTDFDMKAATQTILVSSDKKQGLCRLKDVWAYSTFNPGDQITIQAVLRDGLWYVDGICGYVSLNPSVFISSTSLVGSMFCLRRGVLTNFHKGIDSSNKAMVVGSIVHSTLQSCITRDVATNQDIEEILSKSLQDNLQEIYSSGLSIEETKKEAEQYVPQIKTFFDTYIKRELKPSEKNFQGIISEVVDIEETVTSSLLGMKGRVDITVKVGQRLLPLELKTGRPSFSNEHRSQLALYTLLMSENGREVSSGLLLYLKDMIMKEVTPSQTEKRDLVLLRNQFVAALRLFTEKLTLPEPIRLQGACTKCPYLTICTAHIKHEGLEKLSDSHPMHNLVNTNLSSHHVDYLIQWSKMVIVENNTKANTNESIAMDLKLEEGYVKYKGEFKHTWTRRNRSEGFDGLQSGSFVSVSTAREINIAFGSIVNSTSTHLSVLVGRDLSHLAEETFIIQLYVSDSLMKIALTNLAILMEEENLRLREIVIDKKPPIFVDKLGKKILSDSCMDILKPLNSDQRRAILKVLTTEDYLLVRGPPGTGKTQTIVALIKVLSSLKQRILIVSHAHSSVDNILIRLPSDIHFIRFGHLKNINTKLHDKCFATLSSNCKTIDDFSKIYDCKIMASTCLGIDSDLMKKQFDVCIVDESTQILQPEILRSLFCCKKFILFGDSDQLRPVVKSKEAVSLGMQESLFERLETDSSTVSLKCQYRMNSNITDLVNKLAYNNLQCANELVANRLLIYKDNALDSCPSWLANILSNKMEMSVVFIDTSNYFDINNTNYCLNLLEVSIVKRIVEKIVELGVKDIGVMSPYRMQVDMLKKYVEMYNVEVNTVDQYQGRDKEVIIYSCTKQKRHEEEREELLSDARRLIVAVTRAKSKLIIIGDKMSIIKYKPMAKLLSCMKPNQIVKLSRDNGFVEEVII